MTTVMIFISSAKRPNTWQALIQIENNEFMSLFSLYNYFFWIVEGLLPHGPVLFPLAT